LYLISKYSYKIIYTCISRCKHTKSLLFVFTSICSIRENYEWFDELATCREKIEEDEDVCWYAVRLWEEEKLDVQCWVSRTNAVW
jgi:hypothetical protein